MKDLKIRVNGEAENKEAQGIFKILGGAWSDHVKADHYDKEFLYLKNGVIEYDDLLFEFLAVDECKEITLPELRDLVVLKRNSIDDATHTDGHYNFYVGKDKNYFFSSCDKAWRGTWKNVDILKPIEKPMKEYLIKSGDGKYLLTHHDSIGAIEIPQGAECLTQCGKFKAFWKDGAVKFLNCDNDWDFKFGMGVDRYIELARENGCEIVWLRHTHPEELPFIDDDPLQSLNDQYAEIEKVRQSAWQKQEGGSHYKNLKIQPMQYALENKLDYAQANVVKYVTRHKEKNGKEDLLKAIHNIELMIEFYYGDEK